MNLFNSFRMALQSMLFSFLKILLCVLLFYLVDISYFIITVRNYILFKTENFLPVANYASCYITNL